MRDTLEVLLLLVLGRLVAVGGGLLPGLGGLVGVVGWDDLLDDAGDGLVARGAIGQVEQVEDPHPDGGGKV